MTGTYTRKEWIYLAEGKIELAQFDENPRINITNKLAGITEKVLNLDEFNNTSNLGNGTPGNTILTYHVTHFEPYVPQYKKLKNGVIVSLALRMKHEEYHHN